MKKCTVIVSAYKEQKWIMECINSFLNQKPIDGWEYKLVIGVDGCEKTAAVLQKNKIPYWWNEKNIGVYTMINSMFVLHDSDIYLFFGADDVPFPNCLAKSIPIVEKYGYTMLKGIQRNEKLEEYEGKRKKVKGQIFIKKEVFNKIGGFYHYRTSCDTDLKNRLKKIGYSLQKPLSEFESPLFYRRIHKNSLTHASVTGLKSDYRRKVRAKMKKQLRKEIIKIKPKTTKLIYIE